MSGIMPFLVIMFVTVTATLTVRAEESIVLCPSLQTLSSLLECMEKNHPEYTHSLLMEEEAQLGLQQAKQFKNPEFSLRSVGGDNFGMGIGGSELAVTYPFPISARRSTFVDAAKASGEQLKAQALLLRHESKTAFIKDAFRMRQIDDEQKWYKFIFDQLQAQRSTYLKRVVREPEQDVFLSLVQLLIADNLTKQSSLDIESRELKSRLQRALGHKNSLASVKWPLLKKEWPDLGTKEALSIDKRPELVEIRARQDQALAEWNFAKASTWPEFNFGPVIQRANEGPSVYYSYGLQVTFELPVLSWNQGARALKSNQYVHATHEVELMKQKQEYVLETYIQQYKKTIEAQSYLPSSQEVTRKAQQTQNYFQRGMISGPTIIESYRQTMDSVINRHHLEILTLDAFIWLKITQGKDPAQELEALL